MCGDGKECFRPFTSVRPKEDLPADAEILYSEYKTTIQKIRDEKLRKLMQGHSSNGSNFLEDNFR